MMPVFTATVIMLEEVEEQRHRSSDLVPFALELVVVHLWSELSSRYNVLSYYFLSLHPSLSAQRLEAL